MFCSRTLAAVTIIGISVLASVRPAAAYRPFDGTDAVVADVGEVEIELQPIGVIRAGSAKGLSDTIFNYGVADRWEVVLQVTPQIVAEGAG